MNILPIMKYCELEGVSENAVRRRIQKGMWRMNVEVIKVKGYQTLFVDLDAVERHIRDPKNREKC